MPDAPSPETLLADRRWIEDLARRLVRDPNVADDVAQETWRRVLEKTPARLSSPRGWLRSVMKSCAREQRRSDTRRRTRERAAARPEATSGAAHLVARADAQQFVLSAVLALDPRSREIVLLRFFEDLEPQEIARRIGAPAGTVRSRLHRALADLRARLDHEYGGDRSAWSAALLGPRWESAASSTSAGVISKGALAMTLQTKAAIGAAALLALLLVSWMSSDASSAPAPKRAAAETAASPASRPAPVRRTAPTVETDAVPPATSSSPTPDSPAPAPAPTPAVVGPTRLSVRLVRLGDPVSVESAAPEGLKGKHAALGGTAGGVTLGGGGVIAIESKWRPVPEKGTATLRGKVVDSTGAALAGAQILRVEAAAGGADGDVVNYAHIALIGESAADGSFTLDRQPARAYRLAADWRHAMDRPRGLLFGGVVAVEPRENQTVADIELRLPIDPREFGAVTGRVLDDEGNPAQVGISVGSVVTTSGADGRFRLAPVPAGDRETAVDDYDFRPLRRWVTVRAGADAEVEMRLTPKVTGPHEIDGVARDPDGKAVADVEIACRGLDVHRRQRTGADGSFRFHRLPALPQGAAYSLFVGGDGILVRSVNGISVPAHGLVVPVERTVKLRLLVRDAATAAALPVFNVTVERRVTVDGAPTTQPVVVTSLRQAEGTWSAHVPRGDLGLFVETPDHRDFHGEVDVPRDGGEFEAVVEMRR